jgi:WD40 repeat protein
VSEADLSKNQELVHDYRKIHDKKITCLETTRNSKWLITGSYDNHVKIISIDNREIDIDFGKVCDDVIWKVKIMADG